MADLAKRYATNVSGKYYVDRECTDCDVCRSEAPTVFGRHPDGHSIVKKQPSSPEEIKKVESAIEICPVQAIGSDGERHKDERNNK